ncbi:MAG: hypothetical protein JWP91_1510 [Fibrobacteres bacterium]|nr:hypothetical protein [Fibrobacterota bacterium]
MARLRLAALLAALPGLAAGAGLAVPDSLNAFQVYGKDWVCIYGDGATADSADIGSDRVVEQLGVTMKVAGSLISGDSITLMEGMTLSGRVNCRGNLYLTSNSSFAKKINVGGLIKITGGNPANNVFQDSLYVGGGQIQVSQPWAANTFSTKTLNGSVLPATIGKPGNIRFGVNQAFPTKNMVLPDTTVDYDPARNCATVPGALFNMSMCGLGGASTDTILTPGRYGDFVIASGNRFHLGPGLYQFRSLRLKSDNTRMIFVQGKSGTTRVLVQNDFTVEPGIMLIAPEGRMDPAFSRGTVLIYSNAKITLGDDAEIWATLISPHDNMSLDTGIRLFGQAFAKGIRIENGFNGSGGRGRWLPIQNKRTLKYSLIHFRHKG